MDGQKGVVVHVRKGPDKKKGVFAAVVGDLYEIQVETTVQVRVYNVFTCRHRSCFRMRQSPRYIPVGVGVGVGAVGMGYFWAHGGGARHRSPASVVGLLCLRPLL
jgi:hypothetical protein